MATTTRTTAFTIKEQLLANGERYSYFQAIRLLRLIGKVDDAPQAYLRIQPKLALGFPETDIDRIEALPENGYRITANFFGLYGVASPLPTFYTEDLIEEEQEGRHAQRGFIDILHHALYPLLYQAWSKYRLQLRVVEEQDSSIENHLYAFLGLHDSQTRATLPYSADLLRYIGLFNQRPRSALGLKTILADAFSPAQVEIESCVRVAVPIPSDQRMQIGIQGHCLGKDSYLGVEIDDVSSNIKVHISDVPEDTFRRLLPDGADFDRLRFLIRFYLIDALTVTVELRLRDGIARTARTKSYGGAQWTRLGLDTWLNPNQAHGLASVTFSL